jgi:hypothetical protein
MVKGKGAKQVVSPPAPRRHQAVSVLPGIWLDSTGANHASVDILAKDRDTLMIRNGLYLVKSKLLDGEEGGATGVSVFRDGAMLGGDPNYYHVGTYGLLGRQVERAIRP